MHVAFLSDEARSMTFGNLCSLAARRVNSPSGSARPGQQPARRRLSPPRLRAAVRTLCGWMLHGSDGCCCDTSSVHWALLGSDDVNGDEVDMRHAAQCSFAVASRGPCEWEGIPPSHYALGP